MFVTQFQTGFKPPGSMARCLKHQMLQIIGNIIICFTVLYATNYQKGFHIAQKISGHGSSQYMSEQYRPFWYIRGISKRISNT